ncbi:MAG: diguanylate cyclase [Candidatus Sericytochromatia bacterium]|nr:diguanylate cyclase [Candidatus Sericytochromatia bacterium]
MTRWIIDDAEQRRAILSLLGLEDRDPELGLMVTLGSETEAGVAIKDPLTGLMTHSVFLDALQRQEATSRRYAESYSLLRVDIDGFAAVNAAQGYGKGDAWLAEVASVIHECIRVSDLGARLAGDDLAVLLPQTDQDGAWILAERIREAVAVRKEASLADNQASGAVSIGLAEARPGEAHGALIQRVEWALASAKEAGGNRVVRAGEETPPDASAVSRGLQFRREALVDAIEALAGVVEAKDGYTSSHSVAVAEYATRLATRVGYAGDRLETFRLAARLHDLGKIGVPDAILKKAGPLSDEEWELMQQHPSMGRRILGNTRHFSSVLPAMVYHHERWDGRGYPEGLAGEAIPLDARIVCIADAYGAMVDDRPYRKGLGHQTACSILQKGAGLQFDPHLVEVFVAMIAEEELGSLRIENADAPVSTGPTRADLANEEALRTGAAKD